MADLYLTPAERYTAALGGFYYGDLPEPGTVYTQLIKDILDGSTPDKEPKNILARFIYSLYISDLEDPYPRYELAKLLYWKLHDITPTKSGSILTVTIDGKEDYMTINTDLSRLWYKVLFGSKTDVITEFPYIFNTMQNKLSDWELFGNTVQSTTPTPDSPVMPQGTGERTGNLLDYTTVESTSYATATLISGGITISGRYYVQFRTAKLTVGHSYTTSWTVKPISGKVRITWRFQYSDSTYSPMPSSGGSLVAEKEVSALFLYVNGSSTESGVAEITNIMLNAGSQPLPYEPYGYKIPISSASTTTPVYLGEVQTTRKIRKLVLTGEEVINKNSSDVNNYLYYITVSTGSETGTERSCFCAHLPSKNAAPVDEIGCSVRGAGTFKIIYINLGSEIMSGNNSIARVRQYLQQQYSAGTPVTVWYVLATEEIGIVNEPLMKIGEYADSMSRTQTGIDIPTVIGQNTLDVLTTVKPSSMSIEYTSADENRSRSKRISLLKSPLKKGLIK